MHHVFSLDLDACRKGVDPYLSYPQIPLGLFSIAEAETDMGCHHTLFWKM